MNPIVEAYMGNKGMSLDSARFQVIEDFHRDIEFYSQRLKIAEDALNQFLISENQTTHEP